MTTRNVTLTLSSDLLTLGDDATSADRDQYGDNIADLLECEFDVKVHQVVGSVSRTECNDAECRSRIRDIEAGDEWTTLLGKREHSDASVAQTISDEAEGEMTMTITDTQIEQLSREAAEAGDLHQVALCERALAGSRSARRVCAKVIADASANNEEIES